MNDARLLLSQLDVDRRELNTIKKEIEALRNASGYHSLDYSQERVQTSPNGVTAAEIIVEKILELEEEWRTLNEAYQMRLAKATVMAGKLRGLRKEYIVRRYFNGQDTKEIAKELHYSESYLFHIGVEACRELDRRGL